MNDNTDQPRVDETFSRMLSDLHVASGLLRKAASPTQWDWQAIGVPLTPAQSQALIATSGAVDDAQAAIDRATGTLLEALRTDDPPRQ